jgi:hypothetical protein
VRGGTGWIVMVPPQRGQLGDEPDRSAALSACSSPRVKGWTGSGRADCRLSGVLDMVGDAGSRLITSVFARCERNR